LPQADASAAGAVLVPREMGEELAHQCIHTRITLGAIGPDGLQAGSLDLAVVGLSVDSPGMCDRHVLRGLRPQHREPACGDAGRGRAHVNFATSTATVEFDPARAAVRDLVGAIEELGYGVPQPEAGVDVEEQSRSRNMPRCSGACCWRRLFSRFR
jgi:hypothetical protein